jgi:SH3-like domain-containing protein
MRLKVHAATAKGTPVQVLQSESGWLRVGERDGVAIGWVHSSLPAAHAMIAKTTRLVAACQELVRPDEERQM